MNTAEQSTGLTNTTSNPNFENQMQTNKNIGFQFNWLGKGTED